MKLITNKLIADWHRQWWKFWSLRLSALGVVLQGLFITYADLPLQLWGQMPGEVKAILPAGALKLIPLVCFLASMAARLVHQEKLRG